MKSPLRVVLSLLILFGPAAGCRSTGPAGEARAQARLGTKAAKMRLYQEAFFRFQRASELEPSNPYYLNNLGVLAEALGRPEQAGGFYEKAAGLAPQDKRIRENHEKSKAYLDSGQPSAPPR